MTALVCKGLKRPKLKNEMPLVKFGNKNRKAKISPTNIPTTPKTILA